MMAKAVALGALGEWARERSREDAVLAHAVRVNASWWSEKLVTGAVADDGGNCEGSISVSRARVFDVARETLSEQGHPLRLLWHTLAWGTGTRHRNNGRRITSVHSMGNEAEELLLYAAQEARTDPGKAFDLLKPRGTAIKYLGPAFFTKYMYFAGGGRADHPSLIVDQYVLATLHRLTGDNLLKPRFGFGRAAYLAAVQQMQDLAGRASQEVGRAVAADEVERWAFEYGKELVK
ncbi:hypothetical protein ACQ3I4_09085 [Zafaria sp. Z1313]|uniref:8-oxoguanine DNA glycosylase OGG fold protein n=1 Tax=Zafaria sp. Z1313 TaxID=3423202 RepID=UPI003D303099